MDRREFLSYTRQLTTLALGVSSGLSASYTFGQQRKEPAQPATGPLRVSPKNPRYFSDATGREVLLVGSHTWNSLADPGNAYVVYIPGGGKVKVSLGAAKKRFAVEWSHPSTGKAVTADAVPGGTDREFTAPFDGDAVLRLCRL